MDWDKQPPRMAEDASGCGMFVKVMTDEQMEVLRKQIAIYATICEQLVELHKSLTSHNDLAGARLGNMYCDPLIASGAHKISGRQRWTPTAIQLQILERMFEQGIGTPSKQKIKEITAELSQHGQISETNVYNWFQNRRARSKRKHQHAARPTTSTNDSEAETEVESPHDLKNNGPRSEDEFQPQPKPQQNLCFQRPQAQPVDPNTDHMPFYGSMLSNTRMNQFMGKMENYNPYIHQDGYNME